jgi:hypothetical protein
MFGTMLQVSLLLVNAIAILNEERFLTRSTSRILCKEDEAKYSPVGWASPRGRQVQNPSVGYNQGYDQTGYGDQDVGVKARLVELINAVRTLMRSEYSSTFWPLFRLTGCSSSNSNKYPCHPL